MRRALLVDLSQHFGGADIRVCDVAQNLGSRFEIHVAVLAGGDVRRRLEAAGLRVWPLARTPRDPRLLLDLVSLIRRLKPEIVDAHNAQSQVWGLAAARFAGVSKRIATVHSVYELSEAGGIRPWIYAAYPVLLQGLASEAVAVCASVGDYLRARGFMRRPVHVIANGVSLPRGLDRATGPGPMAGRLRVAIVGRLVPVKGHDVLIDAVSRLRDRLGTIECLVIGDGPERARLEAMTRELGLQHVVRFLGHRSDVLPLVAGCNVLCMPSLTEGLPYAALEAAMLGVPIVASEVGGLAQEFKSGETAILFPAGDAEALARALCRCASEPGRAASIASAAKAHVRAKFSLDRMIAETAALYLEDVAPARARISAQLSATRHSPGR